MTRRRIVLVTLSVGLLIALAWVVLVLPVISIFTPDPDRMTEVLLISVGPPTVAAALWLTSGVLTAIPVPPWPWSARQYRRTALALLLCLLGLGGLVYATMLGRALTCRC